MKRREVSAFQKETGMADRRIDPAKLRVVLQGLSDQQVRHIFEEMVDEHGSYRRDKYLAKARRSTTPAQRKALRGVS